MVHDLQQLLSVEMSKLANSFVVHSLDLLRWIRCRNTEENKTQQLIDGIFLFHFVFANPLGERAIVEMLTTWFAGEQVR